MGLVIGVIHGGKVSKPMSVRWPDCQGKFSIRRWLGDHRRNRRAASRATVADDVVFTSTYDGVVYAFATRDASLLWQRRMRAGVNACPAVAGDMLLIGAGIRRPNGDATELVAFGLAG